MNVRHLLRLNKSVLVSAFGDLQIGQTRNMYGCLSLGPGSNRAMLLFGIESHALEVFHFPTRSSYFGRGIAFRDAWTVSAAGGRVPFAVEYAFLGGQW